ncbi:dehydrogenase [Sphingobium lactosutens]|uniref:zinc-binding alcohol dehydrogenase family protein n=1 Tax=Sphingobium lactosutens TaxID=522773 RepID=UPI0015BD2A03|nr:zinc-binding alcohol dehydrogenase family protein [Sphingobium lactosutens]NWK97670.1 dehydrogenase [Sphingobium lactosutens]
MNVVLCPMPGKLELTTRPKPVPADGEVLVRIRRVGICGTDYHIFRGTQPFLNYPRVFGHELAGEVVEGDKAGRFEPGSTVCIMPYLSCGQCVACRRGKTNCCRNIEVLGVHRDGGLAEYLAIDPRFLLDARGLSLDQAAMVEFLAIGRHAVVRGDVGKGQRILVVGSGPIGMAVTLFASQAGGKVTVLDGNSGRTALCVASLGATHAIAPDEGAAARLAELTDGDYFDVVFDATGSAAAMATGFRYVAHGGAYVLVSVVQGDITFNDPEFHKRETSLYGSRNATLDDFAAVIDAIREACVPTDVLHTHSAPLATLPDVLPEWMKPEAGVMKAIVEL